MKQVKITTSMLKRLIREELEEQLKNKKKIQEAMSSATEKIEPEADTSSIPRENIRSFFSQFDDPNVAAHMWVEAHGKAHGKNPPRYDFMFWAANDSETPQELKALLASHPNPLISQAAR